jgi:glutamine amidotransferase
MRPPDVAIVDYGMGNLYSIESACAAVGLTAVVTAEPEVLTAAPALILPGVGAFGEAMRRLGDSGLDELLRRSVGPRRPVLAICLGMQLLFEESEEFGDTRGLGLLPGRVVRFPPAQPGDERGAGHKVPAIGWSAVSMAAPAERTGWAVSPLTGIPDGEHFYFIHSYYVRPDDPGIVATRTTYAGVEFASSLVYQNVFACQFHPERSGPAGLQIYRNLAAALRSSE